MTRTSGPNYSDGNSPVSIVYSDHSSDVSMTSVTSPSGGNPQLQKKAPSRFTSVTVPESPRKIGLFNSFKLKTKKDPQQSPRDSSSSSAGGEPSSLTRQQQQHQLHPNFNEPSRRFSTFLDHFRPRAKSDSRSKKFLLQKAYSGADDNSGNLTSVATPQEEKRRQKMAADQLSVYATIHGGQRPPMATIPSVDEEPNGRMELDLHPLYVDTSLANRPATLKKRPVQSLSGRCHVARWPESILDRKRSLSGSTDLDETEPHRLPHYKTSALPSPSTNAEPTTPTRRYQALLKEGFYKMIVQPIRAAKRSLSISDGGAAVDDDLVSPGSAPPPITGSAPITKIAVDDSGFLCKSYPRSTSAKAPHSAQRSLDSDLPEEKSSKRLILFKESALASGVQLMQAANLENKELLFYHLLKVNNAFNILPNSSKVVVFDIRLPVKKAFYALVYNSVRAATLVNSEQQFVGMLTITDFIQILHNHEAQGKDYVKELENNKISDWKDSQAGQKLWSPFLHIYSEQSLFTAVEILLRNKVHRLPIIDSKTHNILYILTLKRLLKYLYLYTMDLRPSFLNKTPKELGIGTYENIVTGFHATRLLQQVTHDTTLRSALRKFMDARISSLPVVDHNQVVQDIYCKFDVINLVANNSYENLDITVQEALQQRRASQQRDDMRHRTNFFEDVIKCSPEDCLWKVIESLVICQIHRIMLVDDKQRLHGLVSLSDIFQFFIVPPVEVSNVIESRTSAMIDADMADSAPSVGPFYPMDNN